MAGGKLSARQKMINLMYLVFIAMMAMNMSKEVLSAFGLMDAKFKDANEMAEVTNTNLLDGLKQKADEKPNEFKSAFEKAEQISKVSEDFFKYIEKVKKQGIIAEGKYEIDPKTGMYPFESMDKTDILDELWFTGDRLTKQGELSGEAFMAAVNKYKQDIKNIIGDDVKYIRALETLEKRFNTEDVVDNEGTKKMWLDYHFKGFPAIASYTKLTAMQNDVKATETNMYNVFLGNTLDEAVSLKNYEAIVIADKSAFFAGEKFQGKVVLGKYANVTPTKLVVNNREINLTNAIDENGAARLDFTVGNVGEHEIEGEFTFLEDGKELPISIKGNYVVVPRPNSATISADKMNVVYRGVVNPMTISFAGVPDNKVNATAPGLRKVGDGKYEMMPGAGGDVTINVTATLDDGSPVNDRKTYRIKDIPKPTGSLIGKSGVMKLPRRNVEIGTIDAKLEDFDFDLPIQVTSFSVKVPGQPTVNVNGTKLNDAAKSALGRARRGDAVQILNIQAKIIGNDSYRLKEVAPIIIELTD
ncbi:gliding motility protein GldM [Paucihalobacter ruber]|uniref:Gliding motility protein GldM n=1 Tax=Paucihalobacter ruber TaxID=2567861 RepID=A0A506PPI8_9FLAO|nr:gliding motility protein GldM [Paucihalobacter ruber]TPV35624.1 gliding motility protein GldM [Paucihalobacter ruber]